MRIEVFGVLLVATTAFGGFLPSLSDIAKTASTAVESGLASISNSNPSNDPNSSSFSQDVIKAEDEIVKILRDPKPEAILENLRKLILNMLDDHRCPSEKHSSDSGDKSSDSDKKSSDSDMKSSDSHEKSSGSDKKSSHSDKKPSDSDKKSSHSDKKPSDSDKKSSHSDKKPSDSDKKSSHSDKKPSDSDKKSSHSDKKTAGSDDKSSDSGSKASDSSDESKSDSKESGKGEKRRDASNDPKELSQQSGLADLLKQVPQGDLCKLLSGLNFKQGEMPKIPAPKDISQLSSDIKKVIEQARNLVKKALGGSEKSDLPSVIQNALEKALKSSEPVRAMIKVLSRIVKSYFEAMKGGNPQLSFALEVLNDGMELVTEIVKALIKVGSEHGPELIGKGAAAAVGTMG